MDSGDLQEEDRETSETYERHAGKMRPTVSDTGRDKQPQNAPLSPQNQHPSTGPGSSTPQSTLTPMSGHSRNDVQFPENATHRERHRSRRTAAECATALLKTNKSHRTEILDTTVEPSIFMSGSPRLKGGLAKKMREFPLGGERGRRSGNPPTPPQPTDRRGDTGSEPKEPMPCPLGSHCAVSDRPSRGSSAATVDPTRPRARNSGLAHGEGKGQTLKRRRTCVSRGPQWGHRYGCTWKVHRPILGAVTFGPRD
jgi:hypothetical protein